MMWEALREAVDEEMERDANVCVMGEHWKGHLEPAIRSIAPQLPTTPACR